MRGCQRRKRAPTFFTFQPSPPANLTRTVLLTLERWKHKIEASQKTFATCQCKILHSVLETISKDSFNVNADQVSRNTKINERMQTSTTL